MLNLLFLVKAFKRASLSAIARLLHFNMGVTCSKYENSLLQPHALRYPFFSDKAPILLQSPTFHYMNDENVLYKRWERKKNKIQLYLLILILILPFIGRFWSLLFNS